MCGISKPSARLSVSLDNAAVLIKQAWISRRRSQTWSPRRRRARSSRPFPVTCSVKPASFRTSSLPSAARLGGARKRRRRADHQHHGKRPKLMGQYISDPFEISAESILYHPELRHRHVPDLHDLRHLGRLPCAECHLKPGGCLVRGR